MTKIIFRQKAIDDLNNIWRYTFDKWSECQADKYYTSLKISIEKIGDNPMIGKRYSNIKNDLKGYKSGKHIIFYHLIPKNKVEIIRILHVKMDLKNRIQK